MRPVSRLPVSLWRCPMVCRCSGCVRALMVGVTCNMHEVMAGVVDDEGALAHSFVNEAGAHRRRRVVKKRQTMRVCGCFSRVGA